MVYSVFIAWKLKDLRVFAKETKMEHFPPCSVNMPHLRNFIPTVTLSDVLSVKPKPQSQQELP
jgi:hypothetical protein